MMSTTTYMKERSRRKMSASMVNNSACLRVSGGLNSCLKTEDAGRRLCGFAASARRRREVPSVAEVLPPAAVGEAMAAGTAPSLEAASGVLLRGAEDACSVEVLVATGAEDGATAGSEPSVAAGAVLTSGVPSAAAAGVALGDASARNSRGIWSGVSSFNSSSDNSGSNSRFFFP